MLSRIAAFLYGVACYLVFFATFLYAIGFLGNFGVPKSIDSGPQSPFSQALAINAALLGLFAVQHSVMARPWFKAAWTRIVPLPVERSTYVLFSSAVLLLLFWEWQPMGGVIWNVGSTSGRLALEVLFAFGWLTILIATFLINHFDLFGLRQVWLYLRGRPYTQLEFRTPGPYRLVRHPLYVGWLLTFWSAPVMTSAHLVFAIATTAYIFVAIQFEERRVSPPSADDPAHRFLETRTRHPSSPGCCEACGLIHAPGLRLSLLRQLYFFSLSLLSLFLGASSRAGGRGVAAFCFSCHCWTFFSSSCPCCGLLGCTGAAGLANGCDHPCCGRASVLGSGVRAGSGERAG